MSHAAPLMGGTAAACFSHLSYLRLTTIVNMRVTVALAALAAAASAIPTELRERQDGHNDKPCKKKSLVTSVDDSRHVEYQEQHANIQAGGIGGGYYHQEIAEGCSTAPGLCL
jgi:hypothetical protein